MRVADIADDCRFRLSRLGERFGSQRRALAFLQYHHGVPLSWSEKFFYGLSPNATQRSLDRLLDALDALEHED